MEISLSQLHQLFAEAYAVAVNDTLYLVGYECGTDVPYVSTNEGYDYVSFESVDGEITLTDRNTAFMYIEGEPIEVRFLTSMSIEDTLNGVV